MTKTITHCIAIEEQNAVSLPILFKTQIEWMYSIKIPIFLINIEEDCRLNNNTQQTKERTNDSQTVISKLSLLIPNVTGVIHPFRNAKPTVFVIPPCRDAP